jgi:hypothetical protein
MRPLLLLFAAATLAAGCRHRQEAERFALDLLAAARSDGGIGPDLVDAQLVEKVRRLALVRRTMLDTHDRDQLLGVLSGEAGPDRQYPAAARAAKQRERATRGLAAVARGACRATVDESRAEMRVKFLVEPFTGAPDEVAVAQAELERGLRSAELVRLDCVDGKDQARVGVLAVRGDDGKLRAVDIYPIGTGSFEVSPNDPRMR